MGERSAARLKSGESVRQSDPGLRRPTPPATSGRKPEACPALSSGGAPDPGVPFNPRVAGPSQRKTGRGAGQSPAASVVDCSSELDAEPLARLLAFFKLLDEWERKLHAQKVM
jgi:hypothetical protein